MSSRSVRRLAKAIRRGAPPVEKSRHARGVVAEASMIGQTMVILDGGTVAVPAFNFSHTTSLTVGTVVRVLVIDKQIEILGAYNTG